MSESNLLPEMQNFFKVIESLIEREIIPKSYFICINKPTSIKIHKDGFRENVSKDEIIYLRFSRLFKFYKTECMFNSAKIDTEDVFLKSLKKQPYYIGLVASKRFQEQVSSCYALKYSAIKNKGFNF